MYRRHPYPRNPSQNAWPVHGRSPRRCPRRQRARLACHGVANVHKAGGIICGFSLCRQGNAGRRGSIQCRSGDIQHRSRLQREKIPVFCAAGAAAVTASAPVCSPAAFFCPRMAVATVFIFTVILGLFSTRSTMILEARNWSRRCNTVTEEPKRVRNSASSSALSPPPTTTMGLSLKKKPSQVAQYDTP